jgi:hypothetical protein
LRLVVVLGDGAKWIWERVATYFGDERTEIVYWFRASQHIWTAAKRLHGDDSPETKARAKTALDALWTSGLKTLLEWFDASPSRTPAAADVLKRERGDSSVPTLPECAIAPYASSTCRLAPAPSRLRPNTSFNTA